MKQDIRLSHDLGFLRIGAAVPVLRVADVDSNVTEIIDLMKKARQEGVQALGFPELAITGYTLGDLVQHHGFINQSQGRIRQNSGMKARRIR